MCNRGICGKDVCLAVRILLQDFYTIGTETISQLTGRTKKEIDRDIKTKKNQENMLKYLLFASLSSSMFEPRWIIPFASSQRLAIAVLGIASSRSASSTSSVTQQSLSSWHESELSCQPGHSIFWLQSSNLIPFGITYVSLRLILIFLPFCEATLVVSTPPNARSGPIPQCYRLEDRNAALKCNNFCLPECRCWER